MSKYIYPEDGIETVTFEKKSKFSHVFTDPVPDHIAVRLKVDVSALDRLKFSCDLLMQAIGSRLLRWSGSSGIK